MKSWCNRGVALKALGRLGESVASYDRALQLDPRDVKTWFNKANALAAQKNYQEALVCFQEAHKLGDPNAAKYVEQCRRLLQTDEGNHGVVPANTNGAQEWFDKAADFAKLKKHADAVSCYENGLKLNPNNAAAWFNMAHSMGFLGRHQDVIKYCDHALQIHPDFAPLWIMKGLGFISMEHFRDAMDCFQHAEKLGDTSAADHIARCRMAQAEWYFRLGSVYQQEGNNVEAANCYEKGLADVQRAAFRVHVGQLQTAEFGAPDARRVKQFQHGAVAHAERIVHVGDGQQLFHLGLGQHVLGQLFFRAGHFQFAGRVVDDDVLAGEPAEPAFEHEQPVTLRVPA